MNHHIGMMYGDFCNTVEKIESVDTLIDGEVERNMFFVILGDP